MAVTMTHVLEEIRVVRREIPTSFRAKYTPSRSEMVETLKENVFTFRHMEIFASSNISIGKLVHRL